MTYKMVAPCHFGLEKTLAFEIKRAGGENVCATDGRVTFSGDFDVLINCNMSCSVAERIGLILAEFDAPDFDAVFDTVKAIKLSDYLEKNAAFPVVKGQSVKSKLTSIPALQRTVKKALAESMIQSYGQADETGAKYDVRFFLFHDNMTLFLDSSGVGLHKRGYRAIGNDAPIRETLAAGICDIAHIRAGDTVVDPMCGSGTILIESALKALRIAPCINRNFSAQNWGFIPRNLWDSVRGDLRSKELRDKDFEAIGYDIDPACAALTNENAKKAGVARFVLSKAAKLSDFSRPEKPCKIITNPPYAERMNDEIYVKTLIKEMGVALFPLNGNELHVITPSENFEQTLGQKARKNRKLYNGMIQCRLWSFSDQKPR